ncbi:MAG TPA: hypothetical protein VI750_09320, partial [Pyrinomonadaceae bacterium]|nr:hypothetical protein [Pyrinomonadaceae bacterium]
RALDFRLLVWTRRPNRHPQIRSDVNYRIETLFREKGIEIPFPTKEFLLRSVDMHKEENAGTLLSDDSSLRQESEGK